MPAFPFDCTACRPRPPGNATVVAVKRFPVVPFTFTVGVCEHVFNADIAGIPPAYGGGDGGYGGDGGGGENMQTVCSVGDPHPLVVKAAAPNVGHESVADDVEDWEIENCAAVPVTWKMFGELSRDRVAPVMMLIVTTEPTGNDWVPTVRPVGT